MPGDNQHFIPKHVLQGFAISGRPKFAWEYRPGVAPEAKRLKKIAASYHFYSEPIAGGGSTLDDSITDYENEKAKRISALRACPQGALDEANFAAEIVTHLAMRNDNVRGSLAYGLKLMMREMFGLFRDEDGLRRLLGMDGDTPGPRFANQVVRSIQADPRFKQVGLPDAVVTRIAFGFARERLPEMLAETAPEIRAMLAHHHQNAEQFVRESHNKALEKSGLAPQERVTALSHLRWEILETPYNIILPDCVAIGITDEGKARPLFLTDTDAMATAVMAFSSNRLLIGRKPDAAPFQPFLFNLHAIACSENFFVSAITSDELATWSKYVGVASRTAMHQGIADVFSEYAPPITKARVQDSPPAPPMEEPVAKPPLTACDMHFLGCAEEPMARKIADTVYGVMAGVSDIIPLDRLDGITFAADYPAALAALDRGIPGLAAPATTDEEDAVGVAMAPVVLRGGVIKSHIFLRGFIGHDLISADERTQKGALHILVGELAEVGCVELFDRAFPGVMLKPLSNSFDSLRYRAVAPAWSGYFSARVSASFAPEAGDVHRGLLVAALQRVMEELPKLRLDYRFHGDVPRLLDASTKYIGHVLSHAAHYLGHCDGLDRVESDTGAALKDQLDKMGLSAWFNLYREDLRAVWDKRGEWASFDDLLSLGHHVERLLWQFGMFLSQSPDGNCRLDVPLYIDWQRLGIEALRRPLGTIRVILRGFMQRLLHGAQRLPR